jgi:hypothetical protein
MVEQPVGFWQQPSSDICRIRDIDGRFPGVTGGARMCPGMLGGGGIDSRKGAWGLGSPDRCDPGAKVDIHPSLAQSSGREYSCYP